MSFLAAEALLKERLAEKVTGVRVLGGAELALLNQAQHPAPALFVLFDRYGPAEVSSAAVRIEQTWLVVVAVRNVRDPIGGQGARDDASPLLSNVLTALCGWRPSADLTPLVLTQGPQIAFTEDGFGYFPLAFTTKLVIRGEP